MDLYEKIEHLKTLLIQLVRMLVNKYLFKVPQAKGPVTYDLKNLYLFVYNFIRLTSSPPSNPEHLNLLVHLLFTSYSLWENISKKYNI